MDFADEHYVKLFTRDTVTWLSWPWEGRALFPLLMRKLEHAGVLRVGQHEPARAVALIVQLPEAVVKPGLEALVADGTVELANGALIVPKFNEAQESRKTNAQAKREQREKTKSAARAAQIAEISTTHRQTAAEPVLSAADSGRSGHPPSPALPCPSPALPVPRAPAPATPVGNFWNRMQDARIAAGHVRENWDAREERALATWWSQFLGDLGGDEERAWRAVENFIRDPWAKSNGAPFSAFRKQAPKYASEHYGKTAAPALPQRDEPTVFVGGEMKLKLRGQG